MDWVKKNWILLVCGLLAVAGVGIGVWSLMGFQEVQARANTIAAIASQLEGMASNPREAANEKTIADAKIWWEKTNADTIKARDSSVTINRRAPLRDDVFPVEKKPDSGYLFRIAYRSEMQKLPGLINGGKAPNGAAVDAIVHRMEDKARKEANLTGVGGELRVPKPPLVTPWVAPARSITPLAAFGADMRPGSGADMRPGSGADMRPGSYGDMRPGSGADMRPGSGADMRPGSYGDMRPGSGADMRPGSYGDMRPGSGLARPGIAQPGQQPSAAIPTAEQLRPEAKQLAIYQTAKSIWTYLNDDTFEMHPIGLPDSVDKPKSEDLWAAQMYLWIEQDVGQALRRANEEAIKSRNLPVEDQWVANLPVKHLVWVRLSDYLLSQAAGTEGRGGGASILHRGGGGSGGGSGGVRFGQRGEAFTDRSRTGDFDVVHFAINVVVDARDLPKVLLELCRQNFITPIQVQYRAVNATAAAAGGYLYGSGPLLNVDIACEALFFRLNYESMMPQAVKDVLEGKAVDRAGMGTVR
jgi:hypothetical protein